MTAPIRDEAVTVYWRPGCPYCARLRRGLRRAGLATTEVNIWSDPTAAAAVRRLAGGNETVPTVVVGGTSLVNPSAGEVLASAAAAAAGVRRDELSPRRSSWRGASLSSALPVVQWAVIGALIVASVALDRSGRTGMSWITDGVALAVYLVIRVLRRLRR